MALLHAQNNNVFVLNNTAFFLNSNAVYISNNNNDVHAPRNNNVFFLNHNSNNVLISYRIVSKLEMLLVYHIESYHMVTNQKHIMNSKGTGTED